MSNNEMQKDRRKATALKMYTIWEFQHPLIINLHQFHTAILEGCNMGSKV